MNIRFYYGPDRIPFQIDSGRVMGEVMPFHGIISRGLRRFLTEMEETGGQLWLQHAPALFRTGQVGGESELKMMQELAVRCKTLSYYQSCYCAEWYVLHNCLQTGKGDPDIELWNIKEGHTSSVWRVVIENDVRSESFILNVARDEEAGLELMETSKKLKRIGESFPECNVAKVYDIAVIKDDSLPMEVVVTKNECVENSFEIHSRRGKGKDREELLMVDRFLTDADNPSLIKSVLGRIFTTEEAEKIRGNINDFLMSASGCLSEQVAININDGDVVWNGEKAIVVALS